MLNYINYFKTTLLPRIAEIEGACYLFLKIKIVITRGYPHLKKLLLYLNGPTCGG